MKYKFFFFIFFPWVVSAQSLRDAVSYSQDFPQGNARFMSMAGSFGALGGNITGSLMNAGGIGVYRRAELTATYGGSIQGFNTEHYGQQNSSSQSSGRLTNFGLVFSNEIPESDWKRFNLSFAYNRLANYDYDFVAKGPNSESSKLDRYLLDILESGIFVEDIYAEFPFGAALAWDVLLIDTIGGEYYHALENYGHEQELRESSRGGKASYSFGMGANYDDKIYVGASVALAAINHKLSTSYSEVPFSNNDLTQIKSWQETSELDFSARAFHLRMGVIYWFTEGFRMGLAFNSGENYNVTEKYVKGMVANWKTDSITNSTSPEGINEYRFKMPHKIVLSAALVNKYIGSLNLDAELVTYSRMEFVSAPGFGIDFSDLNKSIEDRVNTTANFRLGGELLLGHVLIRGGAALFGNPQRTTEVFNRYSLSTGIGYRFKRFMVDLTYAYMKETRGERYLHFSENIKLTPTQYQFTSQNILLGMSYRFIRMQ